MWIGKWMKRTKQVSPSQSLASPFSLCGLWILILMLLLMIDCSMYRRQVQYFLPIEQHYTVCPLPMPIHIHLTHVPHRPECRFCVTLNCIKWMQRKICWTSSCNYDLVLVDLSRSLYATIYRQHYTEPQHTYVTHAIQCKNLIYFIRHLKTVWMLEW